MNTRSEKMHTDVNEKLVELYILGVLPVEVEWVIEDAYDVNEQVQHWFQLHRKLPNHLSNVAIPQSVLAELQRWHESNIDSVAKKGVNGSESVALDRERVDTRETSVLTGVEVSPIGVFKTFSDIGRKTISDIGKRASGAIEFSLALLDGIASRLVRTDSDREVAKAAFRRRLAELSTLDPKTWYDVTIEIDRELGSGNFSLSDLIEEFIRSKFDFARRAVREMCSSLSTSEINAFYYVFESVRKLPSIDEVSINSMVCPSEIAFNPFELAKLRACNMWSSEKAELRRKLID